MAHLTQASGRQETERLLGTTVGQFCRLVSTTILRAQAMCLISHVSLITPAAREAFARRQGSYRAPPGLCEVGGAAEEREEGKVDDGPAGAGLGLQGQLPHHPVF